MARNTVGTNKNDDKMGTNGGDKEFPQTTTEEGLTQALEAIPLAPNLGGFLFTLFKPLQ